MLKEYDVIEEAGERREKFDGSSIMRCRNPFLSHIEQLQERISIEAGVLTEIWTAAQWHDAVCVTSITTDRNM